MRGIDRHQGVGAAFVQRLITEPYQRQRRFVAGRQHQLRTGFGTRFYRRVIQALYGERLRPRKQQVERGNQLGG